MLKQIFFLFCFAAFVSAIPVPTCDFNMGAPNEIYTMSGDLNCDNATLYGVNFGHNNITLDCQGFKLSSNTTNTSFRGIVANNVATPTIKNCNTQGFGRGIESQSSPGGLVDNTTSNGSLSIGMYLRPNTDGFTVSNSCANNTVTGIYALIGNFNISNSCASSGAGAGFQLQGISGNVTNVTAFSNGSSAAIYSLNSNNIYINDARVSSIGTYGFLIDNSPNISINNSAVVMNSTAAGANGIHARLGSSGLIVNNTNITNIGNTATSTALTSGGTTTATVGTTIQNVNVDNFANGITLTSKLSGAFVENVSINGRNLSIAITSSAANSTIRNSAISNSSRGVYLLNAPGSNLVENMNINTTTSAGIYLEGATCTNNTVRNATINSTSYYGVIIFSNAYGNLITNSTFASTGNSIARHENLANAAGNTFTSNILIGKATSVGIDFSSAHNNNVSNNTIQTPTISYGIYLASSSNNTITNNILKNTSVAVTMLATAGNNTLFGNNFTAAGTWINDLNGTNNYNATVGGIETGNIYHNSAGVGAWTFGNGTYLRTISPPNWTTNGYCINATTFPAFITGAGLARDCHAWTGNQWTCKYSGGNWLIDLWDRCYISETISIYPNNITFNGTEGYLRFGNASPNPQVISADKFKWNATDGHISSNGSLWLNGTMG